LQMASQAIPFGADAIPCVHRFHAWLRSRFHLSGRQLRHGFVDSL
jgi:hypothetical protein